MDVGHALSRACFCLCALQDVSSSLTKDFEANLFCTVCRDGDFPDRAATFFMLPFELVPKAVKSRQAYLTQGRAGVTWLSVVDAICAQSEVKLKQALDLLKSKFAYFQAREQHRLYWSVQSLRSWCTNAAGPMDLGLSGTDNVKLQGVVLAFLKMKGHSDPCVKPYKGYSVGFTFASKNQVDRTCPFAGRVHKSNCVNYSLIFHKKVGEFV